MKNLFLSGCIAASLFTLTSCLDEGSDVVSSTTVGVVRFDMKNAKLVIDAYGFGAYAFYDPQLATQTFMEGDCVLFNYSVDRGSAENANVETTGLYYGTLNGIEAIRSYPANYNGFVDTTALLPNEQAIAYAIDMSAGCQFVSNRLFVSSDLTIKTDQKNNWMLYCDMENWLSKDANSNKNVYSFFLRTTITSEGISPEKNVAVINAFEMRNFWSNIQQSEKTAGNAEAILRFNYIKKIESDGTLVWDYSDLTIGISGE
jgi:hypothetical protein